MNDRPEPDALRRVRTIAAAHHLAVGVRRIAGTAWRVDVGDVAFSADRLDDAAALALDWAAGLGIPGQETLL